MILSSSLHCFFLIQSLGATSGSFAVDELVHYEKISTLRVRYGEPG